MQKTLLKFALFELIERIARFRLLLNECADSLSLHAPVLHRQLLKEADAMEDCVLSRKTTLNRIFSESSASRGGSGRGDDPDQAFLSLSTEVASLLRPASRILSHLKTLQVEPETALFLRDALPEPLTQPAGEQSVFLIAEGDTQSLAGLSARLTSPFVLLETLSVLQKNNPLGWLSLTQGYARHLLTTAASLESLKLEWAKSGRKKGVAGQSASSSKDAASDDATADVLLQHAIGLRLLGPAYYFQALSEALFRQDMAFLQVMEPALFFGLNHQNFTHKSLVILHEACERSKTALTASDGVPWSEDALASLYRAVEKLIPAKWAFLEKNLERVASLRERMAQGILLSASPLYTIGEVAETLARSDEHADFSIYEPLGMLTETPHSPREIVNAGWLHKMDRSAAWLYSVLNESADQGFERLLPLLSEQDALLRKSIETSEVHRVLLCRL